MRYFCGLLVFLIGSISLMFAQQDRVIELRSADELRGRVVNGEEVRELIGNVHFVQPLSEGGLMMVWCNRALRYMNQNKVELFGDVRIVREKTTIRSQEGVYFGSNQYARVERNVTLERGGTRLTARSGDYFGRTKHAVFTGEVIVRDSVSETRSDRLFYYEEEEKSIAVGRVSVRSLESNVTIMGDSLVHFEQTGYSIVPKNPLFVQIDTTADGTIDTLLIKSAVMEAYQDTAQRFIATANVTIVRSDVAARSDHATYFERGDKIVLVGRPVVWHEENQLTGDSIVVGLRKRKLDSVYVRGRAMAVSRSDSLHALRFDQLTGREITMYFRDEKVDRIEVNRTATSMYYLFDESIPNGANRSSGDRITIQFTDGKVDKIRIVGGVEGRYFPEALIVNRESEHNLEGFQWRTDRPIRKNLEIINAPASKE